MTHETFREMLPLYVIGALDGDELYHFERYVAENRDLCRNEVAEYQAIADQLALAPPSPAPVPTPAPVAPPTRVPVRVPAAAPASTPAPVAAPASRPASAPVV